MEILVNLIQKKDPICLTNTLDALNMALTAGKIIFKVLIIISCRDVF